MKKLYLLHKVKVGVNTSSLTFYLPCDKHFVQSNDCNEHKRNARKDKIQSLATIFEQLWHLKPWNEIYKYHAICTIKC